MKKFDFENPKNKNADIKAYAERQWQGIYVNDRKSPTILLYFLPHQSSNDSSGLPYYILNNTGTH